MEMPDVQMWGWFASSKMTSGSERTRNPLGSPVPGRNGHQEFVPVVVTVKQDELGLAGFAFLQHPKVSTMPMTHLAMSCPLLADVQGRRDQLDTGPFSRAGLTQ